MHFIKSIGIIWALFTSLNMNTVAIFHYRQERYNVAIPIPLEGAAFISCICGGEEVKRDILADSVDILLESVENHTFCEEDFEIASCNLFTVCENCTAEVRKCTPTWYDLPYEAIQFDCILKQFERADLFPPKKEEKMGFIERYMKLVRTGRSVNTCRYPKGLITADVICYKSVDSVLCKQKCLFGYTLKEGITRELSCVHSENVWKPTGFEECRPYIDCSVSLLYEGEVNCFTSTDEEFVLCNITCAKNRENFQVSNELYRCQKDGSWSPKLPFCVASESGIDLVSAPENKDFPQKNEMNNV